MIFVDEEPDLKAGRQVLAFAIARMLASTSRRIFEIAIQSPILQGDSRLRRSTFSTTVRSGVKACGVRLFSRYRTPVSLAWLNNGKQRIERARC